MVNMEPLVKVRVRDVVSIGLGFYGPGLKLGIQVVGGIEFGALVV